MDDVPRVSMAKHDGNSRDEVLRRMLKTPPAPRRPIGKRRNVDNERLVEEIKRNPDKLDELARELGQTDEEPGGTSP